MPATSSAHPLPAAAPIPWNCRCVLAAPKEPQEVAAYCSFRSGVRLKSGLMESCDLKASFLQTRTIMQVYVRLILYANNLYYSNQKLRNFSVRKCVMKLLISSVVARDPATLLLLFFCESSGYKLKCYQFTTNFLRFNRQNQQYVAFHLCVCTKLWNLKSSYILYMKLPCMMYYTTLPI